MKSKISLIGISSQYASDRMLVTTYLSNKLGYFLADFDEPIYNLLEEATGLSKDMVTPETMGAYLGREWSYVREEKFTEEGKITFRPVRYHLTPKQIFNKLKYDLRDVHPDFWVNTFFRLYCPPFTVIPVRYPNQADGIIDRGGIVIRIDNSSKTAPVLREDALMDGYTCSHKFNVDNSNIIETIDDFICLQKKENPDVFTTN